MDIISKEEFTELATFQGEPCITIYVPAHSSGMEVNEKHDVILFKNALQQAKKTLRDRGFDEAKVSTILKPAFELLGDDDFWNYQSEGLAVYLAEKFFKTIKLPISVKEELLINSSFFLSQLLPVITSKEQFYLLVLSKHDAKFYQGDAFGMQKIEVEGLPDGMGDVIHFEEKDERQLLRTNSAASVAGAAGNYHGHGSGLADEKEYIAQYLKEVDQTLWKEVLANSKFPLIIAAVEYIAAIYKQVSHYKHVTEDVITGNYEHEDRNSLFLKAREKLYSYFRENEKKALKNYYDNSAGELTSSIPEDVIPASYYSQVSDLFVQKDQHIWGKFDESNNTLELHEEEHEDDVCLLNKAILKTIMNGGNVHILEKERMPADSKIAALMRYEGVK